MYLSLVLIVFLLIEGNAQYLRLENDATKIEEKSIQNGRATTVVVNNNDDGNHHSQPKRLTTGIPASFPHDSSILNGVPITSVNSASTYHDPSRDHLPLCRGNEHIQGKWRKIPTLQHKDFTCCGWDGEDFMFNQTACGSFKYGRDMPILLGSSVHYAHTGGNACLQDKSRNTRLIPDVREQYVWEPDMCRLAPWDGKRFCELLGRRHLVMAGDSTMVQHLATLSSMIHDHQGGCSKRIMFLRSDYLAARQLMMSVSDIVESIEPDILIVNGGAHFHSMKEFQDALSAVNLTMLLAMEHVPHSKVIFRGQHPGHVGCREIKDLTTHYTGANEKDRYDWYLHQGFDQEMEKLVKYWNHQRITYWNTYPLYLRPDAHACNFLDCEDCLHFALPGPLNFESNLFLTKLITGEL